MNTKVNYGRVETDPTVFITQNRQRVKQFNNDTVYLRDGDEFELELFNPTSSKVLAKIKINDKDLGSGIVLRPGERVFLERYLDEAKKFVFETYYVDRNDRNVQRAIADNGDVKVEFYQESFNQPVIYTTNTYTWNPPRYDPPVWHVDSPSIFYCNTGASSGDITCKSGDMTYTCGADLNNLEVDNISKNPNDIETGRVEKGGNSSQQFEYDSTSFNSWPTWTGHWKILPRSQKTITREEISVYCTGCGAKRRKSSHKFCPHCGTKF